MIGMTLITVSRPYFWLVTAWLFLLPTGRRPEVFASTRFWCGLGYCALPLNVLVYLMNDLADVALDAANPRKGGITGARMQEAELRALVPWAAAMQAPFLLVIGGWCGYAWTACWFAAVFGINWCYNHGPRLSGRMAPLDLLCPCGYMLVIPLSCALCELPSPPPAAWAHTVLFVVRTQAPPARSPRARAAAR